MQIFIKRSCLFSLFFFTTFGFAQHVINLSNIDIIAYYEDAEFSLFEKVGENSFKHIEIYFEENDDGFLAMTIEPDGDLYTLEDIKNEYSYYVYTHEIARSDYLTWTDNDWLLKEEDADPDEDIVLRFTQNGLAFLQYLEPILNTQQSSTSTYNASSWEITDGVWMQSLIFNFGNDRQLLLLLEDEDVIFLGFLLENKVVIITDELELKNISPIDKNTYFVNDYDTFKEFEDTDLYHIKKVQSNYYMYDAFGNDLLGKAYDTIMKNDYFVVGKKDNKYSFYTSTLQKLHLPNVKKVYLNQYNLELLTEDGAYFYELTGEKRKATPIEFKVFTPRASSKYELISYKNTKHQHAINIKHIHSKNQYEETRDFVFTDIKNSHTVTFLNDTKKHHFDRKQVKSSKYPEYLKISNGSKYGLRSYYYTMYNTTSPTDTIIQENARKLVIHKTPALIETTSELPIKYDAIKVSEGGLILFYRKNKIGIFPKQKKAIYTSLTPETPSFYRIVKNGKTGWLDLKTMEEYFF